MLVFLLSLSNTARGQIVMNPSSGTVCEGESIDYSYTGPTGWLNRWRFPGGSPDRSNNATATIVYNTAGTYTTTLRVTVGPPPTRYDYEADVTVNANPTATLVSDDADNIICIGQDVIFTAGPAGQVNYEFFVNGGSVLSGTSTTFSTSSLSNGDVVTVTVTDANGCTDTHAGITMTVNSFASPTAMLSSDDADNAICTGTSVIFTAGPSGLANYEFFLNGGSVQSGTSDTYTTATLTDGDVVTVTVTDANGCPDTHVGITTTVVTQPTLPTAVMSESTPVCEGTDVYATITPGTGGIGCTEQLRARIRDVTTGWYNIPYTSGQVISTTGVDRVVIRARVRNCDAGCNDIPPTGWTNIARWDVDPLPVGTLVSDDADDIICAGDLVTFTAGGGTSYEFFEGVTSVQGPGALTTYATSSLTDGVTVTVVVSDGTCSMTPAGITTTVETVNSPTILGPVIVCNPSTETYTVTDPGSYSFLWTVTNGTIIGSDINSTVDILWNTAVQGTVSVQITSGNGCTNSNNITVDKVVTPTTGIINSSNSLTRR